MPSERKRMSPRQAKRLRTLRARKSKEQISADARWAGLNSGGHFDSQKSIEANKKRWAAYRAAKAAQQQQKGE